MVSLAGRFHVTLALSAALVCAACAVRKASPRGTDAGGASARGRRDGGHDRHLGGWRRSEGQARRGRCWWPRRRWRWLRRRRSWRSLFELGGKAEGGTPVWAHRLRGVGEGGVRVGATSAGTLHVAFAEAGDVDFGAGPKRTNAGREDVCLGTLSGDGALETVRCFGDDLPSALVDFDVDPQGNVALVGNSYSAVDFGLAPIICGQPPRFENSFLARFDATGANTHASAGDGLCSVAFRSGGLVLAIRDGFVSLDAASRPVSAFLPLWGPGDFDPPFFDARPDGSGRVFAVGGLSGAVTVDLGSGPLVGPESHVTGMLVRVLLP